MSAKLLHALTDENPDLQKQIGCMTGIFHLFDRHHILTPRRITAQSPKRLPQGHSHSNNGNLGVEPDSERYVQTATERNQSKNLGETQRVSMESSGASVSSSSCSSSFSSLDYKTSQPESHSSERIIFPETPSRDLPINQQNASQLGRHSLDFRDVVKDSIYREARGLSVKTTMKEEPINRVMKHRDSPRPFQLSKSVDGSFGVGSNSKPRVPVDFKESLRSPGKSRESSWNFNDRGEAPRSSYEARDGSLVSIPKDAPRFSYDGRETRRSSFDSRDTLKSTTKLRELPRLSLDSRESYMRGSSTDPKTNLISKDLQRSSSYNCNRAPNLQQEFGSYKQPTSVVAKLMGLEGLPNSIPTTEGQMRLIKTCPREECGPFSRPSKTNDGSKQNRVSSPRSSIRDPVSPRLRTPDSIMRPVSPRFPIEPAPWKKLEGGRGSQKPASKNQEIATRASNSHPSVYAEIEKRLKELEFRQSDRDLRALRQILDAMQAKGLLEAKKEEDKPSCFVPQTNNNHVNQRCVDPNPRFANKRNPLSNSLSSATVKGATSPRTYESPIVIMKPAKLIEKSNIPTSSVIPIDSLSGLRLPQNSNSVNSKKNPAINRTPKLSHRESANRTLGSTDKKDNARTMRSTKPQQFPTENTGSTVGTSGSVSPKLQQKKLELEKRSRPPIPSSDPSKPRKQSSRQPIESSSPGGKARARSSSLQKNDDQLREIRRDSRNLSHPGDEISQQSDSNNSLNSQMDIEVTSADLSAEITNVLFQQGSRSPSRKVAKNSVSKQKKPSPRLSEDGLLTELTTTTPEQPSPVSVLDSSFYRDYLPTPVKKISQALKDVEIQNCKDHADVDEQNPTIMGPDLSSSGINRTKLENIEHLVKKLRRLNSNHNEATTDYIASLCENTNPDHRYISEILLASGLLLRDLGSGCTKIQLHPSGHPINPDLFFVLEQTKASNGVSKDGSNFRKAVQLKSDQDRLHRKLVFDAVNEVLVQKLALVGLSNEPWIKTDKLTGRTMNAQRLLKDLCSEIEQLQINKKLDCSFDEDEDSLKTILLDDVMRRSENWIDFHTEVPVVALDVERLIFKDLIDEIVSGEAANQRAKTSRATFAK